MHTDNIFLLTLLHGRGVGRMQVKKWMAQFGTVEKVIEAGWDPIRRTLFDKWEVGNWEKDLEIANKEGVGIISYLDTDYPKNLLQIPDHPILLYIKGKLPSDSPSLSIIGTRNATLYGKQAAENIACTVARAGVCVISGLARGIDTAAHEGALKGGGLTVAALGCGLSHVYPRENAYLADKIADSGALISEYPMETTPAPGLFPQRNRIVSGLGDAMCLVESLQEGGGMITMKLAETQKKPLFAVPGRIDWPTFAGNHLLLKEGKARLVENGQDLLKHLNITQNQDVKETTPSNFSPEETVLLQALQTQEKSIEELVLLTQLPVMQLNVLLTRLILKKVVKEFPGKVYTKMIDGKSSNNR